MWKFIVKSHFQENREENKAKNFRNLSQNNYVLLSAIVGSLQGSCHMIKKVLQDLMTW